MFAGSAKCEYSGVRLLVAWTLFAVFCNFTGWILSALHALNTTGYGIAFVIAIVAMVFWLKQNPNFISFPKFDLLRKRFRRPFPLAFVAIAILATIGGVLYAPNNYDGLAYRTPRVLQWLAEGRWHWIHSHYGNLNSRGAAFEWVTAPLFLFTRTDRLEFIINTICFLLLPGRVFAILTRLSARPRVAYYWMWIFPSAYGFLLQAGSIGTDLFSSLWPMAAFEFALRARDTKRVGFAWMSLFAAALMTSSKAFNLLLLPAWGIAFLPCLLLLARRPLAAILMLIVAAGVSMIPTAILNNHYCGDWTGMAAEPVLLGDGPPAFKIAVNVVLVTLQNFTPPIFPFSGPWDSFVNRMIPERLAAELNRWFEPDAAHFRMAELQGEEFAGLGFGVSILLLTVFVRQAAGPGAFSLSRIPRFPLFIALAAMGGALILLAKSGLYAPGRYLLPQYFAIFAPLFATRAASDLVRASRWRSLALITFAFAAILVFISPARPLWPAQSTLGHVNKTSNPLAKRAARVYSVYAQRADLLKPVREALPPSARTVGLISFNIPENSLWMPFGSRRVLHLRREDSAAFTRTRGIEYVVLETDSFRTHFKTTLDEWLKQNNGEVVRRFEIQILARGQPSEWLLIHLKP